MRSTTPLACGSIACRRLRTAFVPPFWKLAAREGMVPDDDAIRCDACPVLCYIKPGRLGACDRYANHDGQLVRVDPHVGPEQNVVRAQGEAVGHVTTSEYGSQMLSLGGVRHLTGGSRKEGTVTCDTLLNLCNGKAVELEVDDGASVVVEAGKPPLVDDVREQRMRVGCGSATIGMFAKQWCGK